MGASSLSLGPESPQPLRAAAASSMRALPKGLPLSLLVRLDSSLDEVLIILVVITRARSNVNNIHIRALWAFGFKF